MTRPDNSLRSRAYGLLQEWIVTQILPPNTIVTEEALSERSGIGRTPIREALQRLAREGLVSIRPRSSIVILEMTAARQLQLLEVRASLQEQTVRLATRRADTDERARMLLLASAVEDAARIGDGELYLRIARDIHAILYQAARNEFLLGFMGSLYALSRQFSFTHLRDVDIPRASATHVAILRAVAARDEEAAARASQAMMDFLYEFTEGRRASGSRRTKRTRSASAGDVRAGRREG
ncbi:MAG: GntR family transcriptional regulator [Burkholderiales bacterium]|nr:GntR family transcriptional regulator [Burkholderiales bacterium]